MTANMNKSDFYFDLPHELIAQTPLQKRDKSRLLVMDKKTGALSHHVFTDLPDLLRPDDLLVINDSKVLPARILGVNEKTGGHMEFLLLKMLPDGCWEVLAKPGKRARKGSRFSFGDGILEGEVMDIGEEGNRIVRFHHEGSIYSVLDKVGEMPLPPYITEHLEDQDRYQTVYARELGSAAAPTAGLHFTEELLNTLKEKGIEIRRVTLHVGLGTFRPVKEEKIEDHLMHTEHYVMSQETADALNKAKQEGRRIVAVGTTSCRTLEAVAARFDGHFEACEDDTSIFIYPGFKFRAIDALITNFHLPESTLIMLVSALSTRENILHAYEVAVRERYRFFSFGDAMFIS